MDGDMTGSKSHFLQTTSPERIQLALEAFKFHLDDRSSVSRMSRNNSASTIVLLTGAQGLPYPNIFCFIVPFFPDLYHLSPESKIRLHPHRL